MRSHRGAANSAASVSRISNRGSPVCFFDSSFAFAFHSAVAMALYRDRMVRIRVDGEAIRAGVLRPGLSVVTYVNTKGDHQASGLRHLI